MIIKDKILVDGELDQMEVTTPQPSQLFLGAEEQNKVDQLQPLLVQTEPESAKNSQFIALAAKAFSVEEVKRFYIAVAQRYPAADHCIMAYALKEKDKLKSGFCDDREFGAAIRIRKMIFEQKSKDTVVFVVRKYGGVHLGFERFQIIEEIAKKAINLLKE